MSDTEEWESGNMPPALFNSLLYGHVHPRIPEGCQLIQVHRIHTGMTVDLTPFFSHFYPERLKGKRVLMKVERKTWHNQCKIIQLWADEKNSVRFQIGSLLPVVVQ